MYWILGVLLVASCALGQETCNTYTDCNTCQTNNCSWVNCTTESTAGTDVLKCATRGNESQTCESPVNITACSAVTVAPNTTIPPTTPAPTTPNGTTGPTTLPPTTPANTTANPSTAKPTTKPGSKTTAQPTEGPTKSPQKGGFDAASFIGGIVLCGGLIALIFFGCKFWKSRSSPNYHTFNSVSFGRKEAKRKHTSKPPAKLSIRADDVIEAEDPFTTDNLDHHVGVLRIYDDEEDQDHIRSGLPESDRDRGRKVSAERERGTIPKDFVVKEFHDEPSDEEPSDDEMLAY
ncbi:PREDICTED: uncharacterized protein LOC109464701 isoform X1 [Branchiostoma belcheri]|uniref:Uncharacterized protein LOC109464701 isoform X1 n=1 Tax=Branchiostoma belcheri TaxID=7741 RepID=A0A6P4Y4K4_BRABE|nr:PREDICTED: uncharacterized protein LOC109464701 isoform X1 [Branchiostoma belcheri]